jgi:dynein heavy chain 1
MNEPAPGVRAQLEDLLLSIPSSKLAHGPAELPRLVFLLSWLAATVGERSSRFTPIGFAKPYSFDDSDFASALDTLIAWVATVSRGKANVDPQNLPWAAIRSTCAAYAFGASASAPSMMAC